MPSPAPLRALSRRRRLRRRIEELRLRLSRQVESLPAGNDSWLETERELTAAEAALGELGSLAWL
jgi:hypothetical protein